MNVEIANSLFDQYCSQTNYEQVCSSAHSDGHLDGDVGGRHTDEHADKA